MQVNKWKVKIIETKGVLYERKNQNCNIFKEIKILR